MKKYLTGVIALGLAICAFAFTNVTKSTTSKHADPCGEASKRWFKIFLDCNSQVSVSDVRNQLNYGASTPTEVNTLCQGTDCVCAIWACPMTIAGQSRPNIGSGTTIYQELYDYFNFGGSYADIRLKNQQGNNSRPAPTE